MAETPAACQLSPALSPAGQPFKFSDNTTPLIYTSITLRPQKVRLQSAP